MSNYEFYEFSGFVQKRVAFCNDNDNEHYHYCHTSMAL